MSPHPSAGAAALRWTSLIVAAVVGRIGPPALQHFFGGRVGGRAILLVFQRLGAAIALIGKLAAVLHDRADRGGKVGVFRAVDTTYATAARAVALVPRASK
jgi:hypothetical protein